MRSEDSRFIKGAKWVETNAIEYGPTLLVALAALGWTLGRNFITVPPAGETWLHVGLRVGSGVALSAMAISGAVLAYDRSGLLKKLRQEKADLQKEIGGLQETISNLSSVANDAWRMRLAMMAYELGLDNTFRINIYRYSPDSKTFRMLGRYSAITKYNHIGRGVYPAETGCIGAAWNDASREAIADDLPDDLDEYVRVSCEKWNFDPETVKSLTMRSRSVYAFTLMDALDVDRTAVLVFESTNVKATDADMLRNAVFVTYRKQLLTDLEILKSIEPSPEMAKSAGF